MGITNSNKVLSQQKMSCRDTVKVTLALPLPQIFLQTQRILLWYWIALEAAGSNAGKHEDGSKKPLLILLRNPPAEQEAVKSVLAAGSEWSVSQIRLWIIRR